MTPTTTKPAHHRPGGYANSDPSVLIGNFPWYEMVWRGLRGDFKPLAAPTDGYEKFATDWSQAVDHARLAQRQVAPVVTQGCVIQCVKSLISCRY